MWVTAAEATEPPRAPRNASNEGQSVRIEGSAIPAGMLEEIQAREAIRCHVASLVVGAVVTLCRDAVANDFAEQYVGEIVEIKDDSPWEREQPWLLPELLVLGSRRVCPSGDPCEFY